MEIKPSESTDEGGLIQNILIFSLLIFTAVSDLCTVSRDLSHLSLFSVGHLLFWETVINFLLCLLVSILLT